MSISKEEIQAQQTEHRALRRSLQRAIKEVSDAFTQIITEETIFRMRVEIDQIEKEIASFYSSCVHGLKIINSKGKATEETEKEEDELMNEYFGLRKQHQELKGKLELTFAKYEESKKTREIASNQQSVMFHTSQSSAFNLKMPDISLPEFTGDRRKFNDWISMYDNLVHNKKCYKPAEKLYILRNALKKEAAILDDTPLEDSAYEDAYREVRKTFENPRATIGCHFRDLLDITEIKKESEIREVLRKVSTTIRGLKVQNINTVALSPFICYIVSSRLENGLRRDWERTIVDNSVYPSFEQLEEYLKSISLAYESIMKPHEMKIHEAKIDGRRERGKKSNSFVTRNASGSSTIPPKPKCALCSQEHWLSLCEKFLAKSLSERFTFVREARLCTNCFRRNHRTSFCTATKCRKCDKPHHTLLHREEATPANKVEESGKATDSAPPPANANAAKTTLTTTSIARPKPVTTLLPSAVVYVELNRRTVKARVLLDGCSEVTLASESFVRRNRLAVNKTRVEIAGITLDELTSSSAAHIVIRSRINNFKIAVNANVVQRIPYKINREKLKQIGSLPSFEAFEFAECEIGHDEIDILLGVEFVNLCLLGEKRFLDKLCFENSQFGWVISGSVPTLTPDITRFCNLITDVESLLRKFWEIEEVESAIIPENEQCEDHFYKHTRREPNKAFEVALPFKRDRREIANTYNQALFALKRAEKLPTETYQKYVEFMREYRELGHMKKVEDVKTLSRNLYYLPHHCVLKPFRLTTKLRVVFNAAAKNASGCSLNEALMTGPTLQSELFDNLIGFRQYLVAFTADVSKMYRCIDIKPEDQDMQLILWRDSPDQPIDTFRLTTVTYGTAPASYLATKCLNELAKSIQERHKAASFAIANEFYMDDLMTGSSSIEEGKELQKVIHQTLAEVNFHLVKYASNSKELLATIDNKLTDALKTIEFNPSSVVSILGLQWQADKDVLGIRVDPNAVKLEGGYSKRTILSLVSKVFDPLGLVAPVTIRGKLIMQDIWREENAWDAEVSREIQEKIQAYLKDLFALSEFSVERCYFSGETTLQQIIAFCDASTQAYGAVLYLRSIKRNGKVRSKIICAKTRVAPVKALTVPRLELEGALLLVKLVSRVRRRLGIDLSNIFAFSDSKIALAWMKGPGDRYKDFVRNRVVKINSELPWQHWRYIKTDQNPADLITRGLSTKHFLENRDFWKHGPKMLRTDDFESHLQTNGDAEVDVPEIRSKVTCNTTKSYCVLSYLLNRFSSYTRLINVTAHILRLKYRVSRVTDDLTTDEWKRAETLIFKLVQSKHFSTEIASVEKKSPVHKKSPLAPLNVFLDNEHLLRVGGRIGLSNFSYNIRHPIVIPRTTPLLPLYVKHIHEKYFHASHSFLLNQIQSRFRVVGGGARSVIKKLIHQCTRCVKLKAECAKQIMGELPPARVNISRAFTHTGVDLTGFFNVKCTQHRSIKVNKAYPAFFVCLVTKMTHIEVVEDLSTESFIAALNRFVSRRGVPSDMYSDNATNFFGTNAMLVQSRISEFARARTITWHFSMPRSPHQGGLWKAAIKAGKKYLDKAIGKQVLTRDELYTVLVRIEAILNSRPLCQVSINNALTALTPAHLAIGSSLLEVPITEDVTMKLSQRYHLLQNIINSFWHNWRNTYLNLLQPRNKWKRAHENLKIGDIVIIRNENAHQLEWPLAVVNQVFPDIHGNVRNVEVRSSSGTLKRSVQGLVKLPTEGPET